MLLIGALVSRAQVGPLSVESYVVFRTRPILEMLEKRARVKAIQLQLTEVFIFFTQMCGTILAASGLGVWVALTVTIAALSTLSHAEPN